MNNISMDGNFKQLLILKKIKWNHMVLKVAKIPILIFNIDLGKMRDKKKSTESKTIFFFLFKENFENIFFFIKFSTKWQCIWLNNQRSTKFKISDHFSLLKTIFLYL